MFKSGKRREMRFFTNSDTAASQKLPAFSPPEAANAGKRLHREPVPNEDRVGGGD